MTVLERLENHFGNANRLAKALGLDRSTVTRWFDVGHIPPARALEIEELTRDWTLPITSKEVLESAQRAAL